MANKRDNDATAALPLADEPALWKAVRNGDAPVRERLIEAYLPFARMLAARLFAGRIGNDLEFCEYMQFATVGLIEGADRYDPDREVLFKTFVAHRINGAVLNGIEHLSEKREQIATHKQLRAERRESGKAALKQDNKDVFQQLAEVAIGLALGYILEDPVTYQHENAVVPENQYNGLEMRQMQERIRSLVDCLPSRERMVIKYHYLNYVPFNIIAETLGITKGRVSQIHRHALELLRDAAKAVKDCDIAW